MDDPDGAVKDTNDDATISKLSAVMAGYFVDPFLASFVTMPKRRLPMINRGYFARVAGLGVLHEQFFEAMGGSEQCQVVSLGAGFDTAFFKAKAIGRGFLRYLELDFAEVVKRKVATIMQESRLTELMGPCDCDEGSSLHSHCGSYHIMPTDLRNPEDVLASIELAGLDKSRPTLFVAECVLVYLEPEATRALLEAIAASFQTAMCTIYEQIGPEDAFGQMMLKNLQERGCALKGLLECPTLAAQIDRFVSCGWSSGGASDMNAVYKALPLSERRRIQRLEHLDEIEEHEMFQAHYCISWGILSKPPGPWTACVGFSTPCQINLPKGLVQQ